MAMLLALLAIEAQAAPTQAAAPNAPTQAAPAAASVANGATAGPPAPPPPLKPKLPSTLTPAGCSTSLPTEPGVITVCAPPPQGYRIDPDVIRAKQIAHDHRLPKKRELLRSTDCQVVGPAGCMNPPTINVVGAVMTAAKMVETAVSGGNVGKLFVTNPEPSEYEIYLAAKADREAEEREKAAQAAALALKAKRAAVTP